MKKLIIIIATAAEMTAAAANANPHTTPEMAKTAQAEIVKALYAAADKWANEAKAEMPKVGDRAADAETRRAAAHKKAIIANEISARAEAEQRKLDRMEKTGKKAKSRKANKAQKASN